MTFNPTSISRRLILTAVVAGGVTLFSLTNSTADDAEQAQARAALDLWIAGQAELQTLTANFVQERQLRAVKTPLKSTGKMWWVRDGGFRFEVGDPPKAVTVQDAKGVVTSLRPKKKKAEIRSAKDIEGTSSDIGFGFSNFFNADTNMWEERLKLLKCVSDPDNSGSVIAEFGFREAKVSAVLRKMVLHADVANGELSEFKLHFRDSSTIRLSFSDFDKNQKVDPSHFIVDLTGYEVDRKVKGQD